MSLYWISVSLKPREWGGEGLKGIDRRPNETLLVSLNQTMDFSGFKSVGNIWEHLRVHNLRKYATYV